MENEQLKYITIIQKALLSLELSCNEYCIADIVFRLSANPANKFGGWCYASKETLGGFLGISKQAVHTIINSLIGKGLVEREEETRHLRTTQLWYNTTIVCKISDSKETLPLVKELDSDGKETLLQDSKETLHNNYNLDNYKDTTEAFETFYNLYPRKINRKGVQRSWKKINPKEHEQIFIALTAYKVSEQWQKDGGKFIPYPATWLNQERWKDELPAPPPKKPFYNGMKMQQFSGKWRVWRGGQWTDFGDKLSQIEWK